MKTLHKLTALVLVFPLLLTACKKDKKSDTPDGPLGPNFPQIINTIVTPEVLDNLKRDGMVINDGLTPPTINGIFLFSPNYCTFDNSTPSRKGNRFDDYKLKFADQNTAKYSVSFTYKGVQESQNVASDANATFISGKDNLFTVFAQSTGVERGIKYTSLDVLSGQVDGSDMKNLTWSHYLVSKDGDDANAILVPEGTTRMFKDNDGSSASQTTFDAMPVKVQSTFTKALSISVR